MAKTAVILQSNYLPWRGYFDLMRRCEVFILYDMVQYTDRDWRNRNVIKTPTGSQWITLPVHHSLKAPVSIDETVVADPHWATKHVNVIKQNYKRARAFGEISPWLFQLLESLAAEPLLSRINTRLITEIAARLGIATPIIHSTQLVPRQDLVEMDRVARILAVCEAAGVNRYLVGPAAKSYLDESEFRAHGIDVAWMSYEGYPEYPQLWGSFEPKVSIVDLLLNTGVSAGTYFPPIADAGRNEPGRGPGQSRDDDRAMATATVPGK
jgi:hypothetical protein